jgi:hypothetical protein
MIKGSGMKVSDNGTVSWWWYGSKIKTRQERC